MIIPNSTSALHQFHNGYNVLVSNSTSYLVTEIYGEGCFGEVAKCIDLKTSKSFAVKIHKTTKEAVIQREVQMLEAIRSLDPEKKNIVRFIENFMFDNLSCLAFEMLDKSLKDLVKERNIKRCSVNEIRPVTCQLLIALEALKDIGIVHTDLKPDNVMLVDHKDQPFRIKLIDFGVARSVSELEVGMTIQPCAYRAPEVTLGLPLSEAVDMWGLGCIMANLYFAINLFPGKCQYQRMKYMLHLLGQPEDHLLSAGIYTCRYFNREQESISPEWRLKSPEEYDITTNVKPKVNWWPFFHARDLDDAVRRSLHIQDALHCKDRMAFISLLKMCLNLDAGKRITPSEALKHNFITMGHLVDKMDTSYAGAALKLMTVSTWASLNHSDNPFTTLKITSDSHGDRGSAAQVDPTAGASGTYQTSNKLDHITIHIGNEVPAPTSLESKSPGATVSEGDSLHNSSNDGHNDTEINSHRNVTGPPLTTDFNKGVRGVFNPSEEESAAANDENTVTGCVAIVCETNKNRASGVAGSTDEATASISSNDGAAAASKPAEVNVREKKNNVFQRTCTLFSRRKARPEVSSPQPPTETTLAADGCHDGVRQADRNDFERTTLYQRTHTWFSRVKSRTISIFKR